MKIKMKVSIASPDWSYAPGDIAEFDDDTAVKFIGNGFADPLEKLDKKLDKKEDKKPNKEVKTDKKTSKAGAKNDNKRK